MTNDFKQVEYAPIDALGALLALGGCDVTMRSEGESFVATVTLPSGYVETKHVTVTATSIGLLVRALELVVKPERWHGDQPFVVPSSIVIGPDGELADGGQRELNVWRMIRRTMGPVLELREMPKAERGAERAKELARHAHFLGHEANGYSLPDHLLVRAGLAIDQALRCAETGFMPSAALLTDFIAAQFDQSSDGQTDTRKQLIWGAIDTGNRFDLPEPWGERFGRLSRNYEWFLRGGVEGCRYIATPCLAVIVPEDVYQAATGYPWRDSGLTWDALVGAGDGVARVSLDDDHERVDLGPGEAAVRLGGGWMDSFYIDAFRELGATEVFVRSNAAGHMFVAPGIAAMMAMKPEAIEAARLNGPAKDPRPIPEVGKRYTVTHDCGGGWYQALVRITYKSDQRLLAVCESRRRGKNKPWFRDGSEAEWATTYGEWREATEAEVVAALV